jgi:rRNA processing protein Gar1
LGKLSHVTKGGDLILKGREKPSLYSLAGTKKAKIGKINDVIGPVSNPYIVVKPVKRLTKMEISSLKREIFYEYRRRYVGKKGRVH